MKRDMDFIRKILFRIESYPSDDEIRSIELEGYSEAQINYHVYLMKEAGLIRCELLYGSGTVAPQSCVIFGLTWAGHDFLEACRDEERWIKAKDVFDRLGGVSFDAAKEVLTRLMVAGITQILTPIAPTV